MFIKKCPQCKNDFESRTRSRKYCSQRCQWDAKKKFPLTEPPTYKICSKCKKKKSIKEFWKQPGSRDGYHTWCKDCKRLKPIIVKSKCKCGAEIERKVHPYKKTKWICPKCSIRKVIDNNGGRPVNYTGNEYFTGSEYSTWKASSKRRFIDWNITKDDLKEIYQKQKGECALSGVVMETFSNSPFRISIDRIDSTKPYVKENVQFVCSIVNVMKNKFSEDVFVGMCNKISLYKQRNANES